MATVKLLIEGYAIRTNNGWKASSSTVFIEDSGKKVIVDPGINRKLLLERMKLSGISIDDIDYVFLTHYHPDHSLLAGIFRSSIILDGDTIYRDDEEESFEGFIPGTSIKVLPTPGHAHEHASLVVDGEKRYVIAGDVFWWVDGEKQEVDINKPDPFAKDFRKLVESRKLLLEQGGVIIPGHGKPFTPEKL